MRGPLVGRERVKLSTARPRGEIGKHSRLKICRSNGLLGSIPSGATNSVLHATTETPMTNDEYRAALEGLTRDQSLAFGMALGGNAATVEAKVREFALYKGDRAEFERGIVFKLNRAAGLDTKTEAEKVADDSAASVKAAIRSADAAERSAAAAARSATIAWYAVVASILTIVVTIALARGL